MFRLFAILALLSAFLAYPAQAEARHRKLFPVFKNTYQAMPLPHLLPRLRDDVKTFDGHRVEALRCKAAAVAAVLLRR